MFHAAKSYFECFGLSEQFALDETVLAQRYRDLQRIVHPDRYANASAMERRLAAQESSYINQAFQILKDPLTRARYLLERRGLDLSAVNGSGLDARFLMEQMELREALAVAAQQAVPEQALANIMLRLNALRNSLIDNLAQQLAHSEMTDLEPARDALYKLQFVEKLRQTAQAQAARLDAAL